MVSLRNGSVEVGSGALDTSGRATIELSGTALSPGTHTLGIVYFGDAGFASSTDTVTVVVTKVRTTIRAKSSKATYARSQAPRLKVDVGPTAYVDGTVTVRLGGRTLKSHVRLVKGKATIKLPKAPRTKGMHRLVVVYEGGATTLGATTHARYRIR